MIFKLLIICLQNANTITNAHQERYATMMEIAWKVTFKINIQFDPPKYALRDITMYYCDIT